MCYVHHGTSLYGRLLADYAQALLLCFKLHESRTAVVSSTATAILRQLVMFVVDKVVKEDRRLLHANKLEPITLPDGTRMDEGAAMEIMCTRAPQFLNLTLNCVLLFFHARRPGRAAMPLPATPTPTGDSGNARVFTYHISALKRLVTSRPALLGVSAQMQGVGVPTNDTLPHSSHSLDSAAGMVATAASATMSNVVGMIGTEAGLSVQSAAMKVQCSTKRTAPLIPDAYIYLLGVQCLVSLSDGLAGYAIPLYSIPCRPKTTPRVGGTYGTPGALDPLTLPPTEPSLAGLPDCVRDAERGVAGASRWRYPSYLTRTSPTRCLAQGLATCSARSKHWPAPRVVSCYRRRADAFLTALAKAALPPRVVAALDDIPQTPSTRSPVSLEGLTLGLSGAGGPPQPPGLSARNLTCLRALSSPLRFSLRARLASACLQCCITPITSSRRTVLPAAPGSQLALRTGNNHNNNTNNNSGLPSRQQAAHPLLADVDSESVQTAIQRLFDSSKVLEDDTFHDFVGVLLKLSVEMVSMRSGIGVTATAEESLEIDDDVSSASTSTTSLTAPRADRFSRRRRSGDFGVARLCGVATLNIQRLVYRPPDVAWDAITSHLLFVLRNPAAPQPIRLQAARTLDDVLAIIPRHVAAVPSDLQAAVQRRVIDVLAQQIVLDSSAGSSTSMELRRMGLETLHQILQASGHTLLVGWETIFEVLGSVCRPAVVGIPQLSPGGPRGRPLPLGYLQEKSCSSLNKIAFQCMMLMCDALAALSPEHLRLCITTLGQFGRQADTNIALTAAESLFGGRLRRDTGQATRGGTGARVQRAVDALSAESLTLQLYGATLSLEARDECVWKVTFPLPDTLSLHVRLTPPPYSEPESLLAAVETAPVPDSSWDESKVVALL
ncbi:hypothetical protein EDB86DRAFT_3244911 [Lactarius hatsudake]|nr:hypothetical protein EDB86DRAFT_3244911 [Lactarius hatsudake]